MTSPQGDLINARLLSLYDTFKNLSIREFNFTYAPGEMVSKWLPKWKCMRLCNFCWQPNPFVTAIYEDTILFGEVLQESLDDTSAFDLNNGTAFAKRYWNRTFFLDTGPIEFDEVGERKQPLIIQQFQKDGVWPVTILMLGASAQNFVDVTPVSWSVPFPPLNEPICGYLGINVLCRNKNKNEINSYASVAKVLRKKRLIF